MHFQRDGFEFCAYTLEHFTDFETYDELVTNPLEICKAYGFVVASEIVQNLRNWIAENEGDAIIEAHKSKEKDLW